MKLDLERDRNSLQRESSPGRKKQSMRFLQIADLHLGSPLRDEVVRESAIGETLRNLPRVSARLVQATFAEGADAEVSHSTATCQPRVPRLSPSSHAMLALSFWHT